MPSFIRRKGRDWLTKTAIMDREDEASYFGHGYLGNQGLKRPLDRKTTPSVRTWALSGIQTITRDPTMSTSPHLDFSPVLAILGCLGSTQVWSS
jgi:hypothetical protein